MQKNHRNSAAFKVSNDLILDGSLTYSAKRVGCAINSHCNYLGACRLSIKQLAKLAQCSSTTTLKAVQELVSGGYITRSKSQHYSEEMGRMIYQKSKFTVSIYNKFTFIPRNIFYFQMKSSSFTIYLFLRLCAGNDTRAFPSLNRICNDLYASKSTVCGALNELSNIGLIRSERCEKRSKAYSCNSYFFIRNATPRAMKKTLSVIPSLRKARRIQNTKIIPKIRPRLSTRHKLFHVSIIQKHSQKINTGG